MTFRIDGTDLSTALEVAAIVGTVIGLLIGGLVLYLLVRPPRRRRREEAKPAEFDGREVEEMLRLIDRMEQRLEVLERAVAVEATDERQLLNAGEESPENRRMR
ncbi:MAG: hypothetical protein ACXWU1_10105 [Allosphingosinicella sp.]